MSEAMAEPLEVPYDSTVPAGALHMYMYMDVECVCVCVHVHASNIMYMYVCTNESVHVHVFLKYTRTHCMYTCMIVCTLQVCLT